MEREQHDLPPEASGDASRDGPAVERGFEALRTERLEAIDAQRANIMASVEERRRLVEELGRAMGKVISRRAGGGGRGPRRGTRGRRRHGRRERL